MSSEVSSSRTLFSFRPKTPEPGKDYDFKVDQFNNWIERQSYLTEDIKTALRELGGMVRRISFPVFSEALGVCLGKLPKDLLSRAVVLGSSHKSNQWVAELACKFICQSKLNYEELGHDHASAITDSLEKTDPERWAREYVLFDDASFSGNQMTGHLTELIKVFEKSAYEKDIYVVVPFVTPVASAKIEAIERPSHIHIHLIYHEIIPTLKMQMREDNFAAINLYVEEDFSSAEEEDKGVATIYFDHKIPNSQSFAITRIDRGLVPKISPPYTS